MSAFNYINDLLKSLELYDISGSFIPTPFKGTDSCFREKKMNNGAVIKQIHFSSSMPHTCTCSKCGSTKRHESKGIRTVVLTHKSSGTVKNELVVDKRRFKCTDCGRYFTEDIPFKVSGYRITIPALNYLLFHFRENTSMACMARVTGIPKSTVYRIFHNNISVSYRSFHLPRIMSIDEFRATTDEGTFAFHITDPVRGKTIDIIGDRTRRSLEKYFRSFGYKQKKKVEFIIMDLSSAYLSIMKSIFPNAKIIADKFHYVKAIRECMTRARVDCMREIKKENMSLYNVMKRNIHLFDQYHDRLNDDKSWKRGYFRNSADQLLELSNKQLVEKIMDTAECSSFKEAYGIYQSFLDILHKPQSDYKAALNEWIDSTLNTKNSFFSESAKNFRNRWFDPILRDAYYCRNNKKYKTSYNNGFVESMNNKVKLVKRNAFGYKYFNNLRKRILLHLGFKFSLEFNNSKKGKAS